MRNLAFAGLGLAALALAGCNSASIKTIGEVAGNSLPAACAVYSVAETYFTNVLAKNSSNNITLGKIANATAAGICANPSNPPMTFSAALTDLNAAWIALQAATTIPAFPPTPVPTMTLTPSLPSPPTAN